MQPIPTAYPLTADEGLGEIAQDLECAIPPLRQALDELRRRPHRVRLRIFQIGARREGAARLVAGEDGAVDLVVVLHRGEVAGDTLVEVGAPRISRLRAAERDDADMTACLVGDGHGGLLACA